jgi:hypothetical protein
MNVLESPSLIRSIVALHRAKRWSLLLYAGMADRAVLS